MVEKTSGKLLLQLQKIVPNHQTQKQPNITYVWGPSRGQKFIL